MRSGAPSHTPDLVFPGRLLGAMAKKVVADGRKDAVIESLNGWRRALVGDRLTGS